MRSRVMRCLRIFSFVFRIFSFRQILQELVDTLSDQILRLYEKLVEEYETTLPQNRSLQCLFDFKFITAIFAGRSDEPIEVSHVVRM